MASSVVFSIHNLLLFSRYKYIFFLLSVYTFFEDFTAVKCIDQCRYFVDDITLTFFFTNKIRSSVLILYLYIDTYAHP